jgi:predicted PurR-regulated permease PerM
MALPLPPQLVTSRPVSLAILLLGTAALVGLSFIVSPALIPGALLLAIIFLLFPFRGNPLVARLMIMAILLVVFWFLATVAKILIFYVLGMLLVYVINPAVTRLERHGIPRWVASLAYVSLLVGGTVALVAVGGPHLAARLDSIDRGLRTILHQLTSEIETGRGLRGVDSFGASPAEAGKAVTQSLGPQAATFALGVLAAILDFLTSFARLAQHVVNLAILPFFMFFLLKDLPRLAEWVVNEVPVRQRERFVTVVGRLDDILGQYFRGAIIVAAIQGAISGAGLWIIGIQYPLLLGILTGFMDFLPYVGLFISLVISSLIAYAAGGDFLTKIILITLLYLSQKLLEATVLAPRIIGPHVGLHPVLLIMCLLLFEYFMGFLGLLIAVPVSAVLMAAMQTWSESQPPKIVILTST